MRERRGITVRGIVQGVGFRPFIYTLALKNGLSGLVRNDTDGAYVEAEGPSENLDSFFIGIRDEAPPLAVVEGIAWTSLPLAGGEGFRIVQSQGGDHRRALVSPDVALCADCLRELLDPRDRRYRYPFINCTNCGPRFTITIRVPYDRATTTMAGFRMCADCQREYDDPGDRRFHAQPNACPVCGPQVRLTDREGREIAGAEDAISAAATLLREGAVLAVKGLGGYHLACDPFNVRAVDALRSRKARQDKPFALMATDLTHVRDLCEVSPQEEAELSLPARPILLLKRQDGCRIAGEVAPRQKTLGVMLAYTPLHHVLLRDAGIPLVMTSGNRSDEPIAYRDEDAFDQLGDIADAFLTHNRPIHMRCDDSVVRMLEGDAYPLRRSRGFAPAPLTLAQPFRRHVLACGGELKNTFCVAKDQHAFLSHHIGDLENYETLRSFREGVEHFCNLFDVRPQLVAYDLHPEYLSTKYARELERQGLEAVGVQHHEAHIAACLADNQRPTDERVIGVAMDGTGYGADGAIWGGEFFEGSLSQGFIRRGHLEYLPLPGGDAAVRQPWRMAVAQLISIYGEEGALELPLPLISAAGERNVRLIARMVASGLNTFQTSSAGRLFDAAAAIVGTPGSRKATYEGQAAIELELAASGSDLGAYSFGLRPAFEGSSAAVSGAREETSTSDCQVVETRRILSALVEDRLSGRPAGEIADRFHRTMAEVVATVCERLRKSSGVGAVALSGGVFQNVLLLGLVTGMLRDRDFRVYIHHRTPPNDGGISLGQAVLANNRAR